LNGHLSDDIQQRMMAAICQRLGVTPEQLRAGIKWTAEQSAVVWQVTQEFTGVSEAEMASTLRAMKNPGNSKSDQAAAARLKAAAPQWFDDSRDRTEKGGA
jgi:transposase-like protein